MHAHRTLTCLKTAFLLSTTLEAFTVSFLLNTPPSRIRSSGSSLYSSTSPSQIVILGGGFAGIQAALTLDSLFQQQQQVNDKLKEAPRPQITLVDPKERFVFLPLLYELCVGDANVDEVAPTFRNLLLHTQNVQFVQGSVYGIDVDTCQVYITGPNKTTTKLLSYDSLILATGSDSTDFTSISGATKDLIFPFYTLEDCYRLRRVFQRLELSSQDIPSKEDSSTIPFKIVVVGGGYSG
jgi:NADH:ubiquinone reductase (non-electrogenic)